MLVRFTNWRSDAPKEEDRVDRVGVGVVVDIDGRVFQLNFTNPLDGGAPKIPKSAANVERQGDTLEALTLNGGAPIERAVPDSAPLRFTVTNGTLAVL